MPFLTERELEDFICEYPDTYDLLMKGLRTRKVLGRQVILPHGRLDLLVVVKGEHQGFWIEVVELKNGPITCKAIAQVLRYRQDIARMIRFADKCPFEYDSRDPLETAALERYCQNEEYLVCPVLIGESIGEDEREACSGANISTYIYEIVENQVRFPERTYRTREECSAGITRAKWIPGVMRELEIDARIGGTCDVLRRHWPPEHPAFADRVMN